MELQKAAGFQMRPLFGSADLFTEPIYAHGAATGECVTLAIWRSVSVTEAGVPVALHP